MVQKTPDCTRDTHIGSKGEEGERKEERWGWNWKESRRKAKKTRIRGEESLKSGETAKKIFPKAQDE